MVKCTTVLVKFVALGTPAQEIRVGQISGAHYLFVERYPADDFITIACMTSLNQLVKQINFKCSDIKEYVCDGIVWGQS